MKEQLNYETGKQLHVELWDFVVNELKAIKAQALYIPNITDIKENFFDMKGYEKVDNLCFACQVAQERKNSEKRTALSCECFYCPLNIRFCIHRDSPFVTLRSCKGTMDYDKAIKLAEEIRDSWEE